MEDIARIISEAKKRTPCVVYVKGKVKEGDFKVFGEGDYKILIGDWEEIKKCVDEAKIIHIEIKGRYSALPLLDLRKVEARVEPGAIIREGAKIGKDAIIMMGAVINIGAEIGERTMVDMNAVIGARAKIGNDCHIGAGAVIAGVLEPPGKKPVVIEDGVLVGANADVLEGVTVGKNSIVAAGAVVLEDVPPGTVVAGVPAKPIKRTDEVEEDKRRIVRELRKR